MAWEMTRGGDGDSRRKMEMEMESKEIYKNRKKIGIPALSGDAAQFAA
jgi:hypothetical protein